MLIYFSSLETALSLHLEPWGELKEEGRALAESNHAAPIECSTVSLCEEQGLTRPALRTSVLPGWKHQDVLASWTNCHDLPGNVA